jgi:hypothetical protein
MAQFLDTFKVVLNKFDNPVMEMAVGDRCGHKTDLEAQLTTKNLTKLRKQFDLHPHSTDYHTPDRSRVPHERKYADQDGRMGELD